MLYLAVASVVYAWTAVELVEGGPPATFREVLGGVLACTLVAALWPLVLLWRGLLGPAR